VLDFIAAARRTLIYGSDPICFGNQQGGRQSDSKENVALSSRTRNDKDLEPASALNVAMSLSQK
jgi:hypothetical protein